MSSHSANVLPVITAWLERNSAVKSAVLFGSSARSAAELTAGDEWSDYDVHLIAADARRLEHVDWATEMQDLGFCMQIVRPATGGVRKVSILFVKGQLDIVVVPLGLARSARAMVRLGLHRRLARIAFNEMATCLHTGYRFLKGRKTWGQFYNRVAAEMPGVRMADRTVVHSADVFMVELLWVFQKIERGELIAAQHIIHRSLVETNLRLLRELRLRRKLPVPSFGLGRRIETLCTPAERELVAISARLETRELQVAARSAFDGLRQLMRELVPQWSVPCSVDLLLSRYIQSCKMPKALGLRTE